METTQAPPNVKTTPELTPIEAACARLKASGLRLTRPRRAILSTLLELNDPATIEQVHAALGPRRCDLVTIYRCLAAFEEVRIVRRSFFLDGICRYHIDLGPPRRYHIVCPQTRRIAALDLTAAAELERALQTTEERLKAQGYTAVSHRLELFGTAPGPAA